VSVRIGGEQANGRQGTLARLVFLGMMAVLVWAPLPLASNRPWAWSLLTAAAGMLLALWAVAALARPQLVRFGWRQLGAPALLFLGAFLWFLLQASPLLPDAWHAPVWRAAAEALGRPLDGAVSVDPGASVGGALRLLAYAAMFWLAAQYGRDPANASRLLWTIAVAGAVYAAYGLIVQLSGSDTILWFRKEAYRGDLTSTFINRNAYGTYAGIGLLATLALMVRLAERGTAGRLGGWSQVIEFFDRLDPAFFLLALGWVTIATALAFSHSRGALASTALATGLFVVALAIGARDRRRTIAIAGLLVLVVGLGVVELSGRGTLGRVVALAGEGSGRGPIHALARRAIADAPWTGYGLDTFPEVFYAYRDPSIPWESPRYDRAHSVYLELLLEAGWIAFAAVMAAIGWVVATVAAGVVRRRQRAVYPCVGLAATALVGVQAIFDFGIQMPAIAVTYWALMGVAYAQSFRTEQAP
jgi:O-antigen ligase